MSMFSEKGNSVPKCVNRLINKPTVHLKPKIITLLNLDLHRVHECVINMCETVSQSYIVFISGDVSAKNDARCTRRPFSIYSPGLGQNLVMH